jgi:tetratricopeptide (TPR) repeat protein
LYQIRGDLEQAEAMYQKALALDEALGHKEGMASDYGNLGNVYRIRGDLEQAEAMYQKALALFQQIGATPQVKQIQESLRAIHAQ